MPDVDRETFGTIKTSLEFSNLSLARTKVANKSAATTNKKLQTVIKGSHCYFCKACPRAESYGLLIGLAEHLGDKSASDTFENS
ncbi:hypothetical protein BES34_000580 [Leptospira inadai serovar Lyme]|uniref:Uncharacterized protein n=1 Tax=Leptospira inadai serovar Lyme TaxID=293084 RepID=A0ABX4YNG2_9LEPT|nr:hypothetical protein BES34_000580 [Leptospira inadai serovar Lyme]